MENLENEFNKWDWKRKNLEEIGEQKALVEQEEMWLWDEYVSRNWSFSQEVGGKNDY
jgi:hypothetical protein